jgi:periplasmic protein TonB
MRLYTIIVSIGAHVAALIVLVAVPLVAMDVVPIAYRVHAFVPAAAADLPEVPPPPRGGNRPVSRDVAVPSTPIEAPDHIEAELPNPGPPGDVPSVPGGVPDGVGGAIPMVNIPPPVAPPTRRDPVRPGGDIRPPTKIKHVAPLYPSIAQSNRVQGTVILEAVINEQGEVSQVRVLRSVPLLDEAAMNAVRQWRFTPTLLNGQAVPIVMTVTVSFQLK